VALAQGITYDSDFINNNLSQLVTNVTFLTGDVLSNVTSFVYDLYFSQIDLTDNTAIAGGVADFMSDALFLVMHNNILTLLYGEGFPPLYSYVFTYVGEYIGVPNSGTPTHGDEMVYLFDMAADNGGVLNAADSVTSQRMLTLWTNFAKTGNPNPANDSSLITVTWDPVNSTESVVYLNISSELNMQRDFVSDRVDYWNTVILPYILYGDVVSESSTQSSSTSSPSPSTSSSSSTSPPSTSQSTSPSSASINSFWSVTLLISLISFKLGL